jgi:D-alanine-D-alanine ligase
MDLNLKDKRIAISYSEEEKEKDLEEILALVNIIKDILLGFGCEVVLLPLYKCDFQDKFNLEKKVRDKNFDIIFNLFEGCANDSKKEYEFVKILEELNIPFTGNGSFSLSCSLNKMLAKEILKIEGILHPPGIFIKEVQKLNNLDHLNFPLIVKPCFEDGSTGIDENSLVENADELVRVVEEKLRFFPEGLVIEEFIEGEEYFVGVLGNNPYKILGISVIDYKRYEGFLPFLTYKSKWDKTSPEFKIEPRICPPLGKKLERKIKTMVIKVANLFRLSSYFRIDIRERDSSLYVLDINPNPDLSPDAGLAKQALKSSYTYPDLIKEIVYLGLKRPS